MPTYPMLCACGHREDVVKPIRDCDTPEPCPKCTAIMAVNYGDKGWAKQGAIVFQSHYNVALGRHVGSPADVREAQRKIEDATGSRPVELGDQKPSLKPQPKDVDMREVMAYAANLQTERGETVNHG